MLLAGGAVSAWLGPEYGVREDGTPFSPDERPWVRRFGMALMLCGAFVLVATLLGYRARPRMTWAPHSAAKFELDRAAVLQ